MYYCAACYLFVAASLFCVSFVVRGDYRANVDFDQSGIVSA